MHTTPPTPSAVAAATGIASPSGNGKTAMPHRWWLDCTFTANTPLCVGDGSTNPMEDRPVFAGSAYQTDADAAESRFNAVAKDHAGKPLLAASGIKGALRAFSKLGDKAVDVALFGAEKPKKGMPTAKPVAGHVHFHNAFSTGLPSVQNLAHGDAGSATYIDTGTAIDRDLGTVRDRFLFNQERVAPGAEFAGSLLVQHFDQNKGQELVIQLRALLQAATAQGGLPMGSDTGRGMGRVGIEVTRVGYFGPDQFKKWFEGGAENPWHSTHWTQDVCKATQPTLESMGLVQPAPKPLHIRIQFTGLYLVNEPGRTQKRTETTEGVAHTPRLDKNGKPCLPASTLQGALRSQCERILRTLQVSDENFANLIREIFGHTNQASVLQQNRPPLCKDGGLKHTQDFIAIDRFTGGGLDGAKFNAEARYKPAFEASLVLRKDLSAEARGLIALALRDLAEGDIPLGWGKRKGYGACTATFVAGEGTGKKGEAQATLSLTQAMTQWLGHAPADDLAALRKLAGAQTPLEFTSKIAPPSTTAATQHNPNHNANDDRFHNPYHFVPIEASDLPAWLQRSAFGKDRKTRLGHHSHARYASAATTGTATEPVFSGRITCTLTPETPFIVGGKRSDHPNSESKIVHPYRLPDDTVAIPASTLKGLISSTAEAASGSALRVLDTKSIISYRMRSEEAYKNLGYVYKQGEDLCIVPLGEIRGAELVSDYVKRTGGLNDAYHTEGKPVFVLNAETAGGEGRDLPSARNQNNYEIQLVKLPNLTKTITLTAQTIAQFEQLADERTKACLTQAAAKSPIDDPDHCDLMNWALQPYHLIKLEWSQAGREWNAQVGYGVRNLVSKPKNQAEQFALRIKPNDIVYYGKNGSNITGIAHSQIWRKLVTKNTAQGEISANYADFLPDRELRPMCNERERVSPAETLFGFVEIMPEKADSTKAAEKNQNASQALAFAGKLRFADALPTTPVQVAAKAIPLKLLSQPKPPSPALYIKPRQGSAYIPKNELKPDKHTLQGRKQYLHALRRNGEVQHLNDKGQAQAPQTQGAKPPWESHHPSEHAKQRTYAQLVQPSGEWQFTIDFDNLSLTELQLLAYSLRPNGQYRHRLGLGKGLGLGSVCITPKALEIVNRHARYASQPLTDPRYAQNGNSLSLSQLASDYLHSKKGSDKARQAQVTLGNPANVTHPVHTPQVAGWSVEQETFKWFSENSRTYRGSPPHQFLKVVTPEQPLPTLNRTMATAPTPRR